MQLSPRTGPKIPCLKCGTNRRETSGRCYHCRNLWKKAVYRKHRNKILAQQKARYERDREKVRANARRNYLINKKPFREANYRKYGITVADYEQMLEKQCGVCKICNQHRDAQRLAVDHCHKTGKVRGLLCSRCNKALGAFGDNPDRLASAIAYLKESTA